MKRVSAAAVKLDKPKRPRTGLIAVGRTTLWLGSAGAVVFGLYTLDARAHDMQLAQPVRLEWVRLPDWLLAPEERSLLNEISAAAGLYGDEDLASGDVCARVAANLGGSPWIEKVLRVTKQPGLVRVEANIRKPLTMVTFAGTAYLVDEKGVRLPRSTRADSLDHSAWLTVSGVSHKPPVVGETWAGQDVAAGLQLARLMIERTAAGRLSCRAEITSIDVSNFARKSPHDGQLRLTTTDPACVIQWGIRPGDEYNIEPTADQKLEKLDRFGRLTDRRMTECRGIDLRKPGMEIAISDAASTEETKRRMP